MLSIAHANRKLRYTKANVNNVASENGGNTYQKHDKNTVEMKQKTIYA
jgi:hypothetical protein